MGRVARLASEGVLCAVVSCKISALPHYPGDERCARRTVTVFSSSLAHTSIL